MKLLVFIFLTVICKAPENRFLPIERSNRTNPFESIWEATCSVESNNNPLAYHMEDNGNPSLGIVQIQPSRVDDFNKRTGKHYKHTDMYDVVISKEVFMYYASRGNLYDMDKVIRDWNGIGEMTYDYLKKVKAKLH